MKKILIPIAIILISAAAAIYAQRAVVSDYINKTKQPELPEAVTFKQVQELPLAEPVVGVAPLADPVKENKEDVGVAPLADPVNEMIVEEEVVDQKTQQSTDNPSLPTSINLAVPFTSQAPHANWSLPYKESCEEASVYMVHEYYQGKPGGRINPDTASQEILKIVKFQNALFGFYEYTDASQTAIIAEQLFGYSKVELIDYPTIDQIKEHLVAGRPVIIPAAGQQLGNPYFQQPGPEYHMLVLRGYTPEGFIANDPGTKRGEGYVYSYDTIMNAIHDWNNGDVLNGKKVIIVIYPEE